MLDDHTFGVLEFSCGESSQALCRDCLSGGDIVNLRFLELANLIRSVIAMSPLHITQRELVDLYEAAWEVCLCK